MIDKLQEKWNSLSSTQKKQVIGVTIPIALLIVIGLVILIGTSGGGEVLLEYNSTSDFEQGQYSAGEVQTESGISNENLVVTPEETYYTASIDVSNLEYINYSVTIEQDGFIKGTTRETIQTENGSKTSITSHSSSLAINIVEVTEENNSGEVVDGSPGGIDSGTTITKTSYVGNVDTVTVKIYIPDVEELDCRTHTCQNATISNITVRSGE